MQAREFDTYSEYPVNQIDHAIDEIQNSDITFVPFMIHTDNIGQIAIDETIAYDIIEKSADRYSEASEQYPPAVSTTSVNMYTHSPMGHLEPTDNPDEARYMIVTASTILSVDRTIASRHDLTLPVTSVLNVARQYRQEQQAQLERSQEEMRKLQMAEKLREQDQLKQRLHELNNEMDEL